jgi:hypothetical protein
VLPTKPRHARKEPICWIARVASTGGDQAGDPPTFIRVRLDVLTAGKKHDPQENYEGLYTCSAVVSDTFGLLGKTSKASHARSKKSTVKSVMSSS